MSEPAKTPLYTCKECGTAVIVRNEKIIRACGHENAGVYGNIGAVAYGLAGLASRGYEDIPTKEEVAASGV